MAEKTGAGKRSSKNRRKTDRTAELVVITGLSGSGKGSVLKALEDSGYYAVDNLPVDLIPTFAEARACSGSPTSTRASATCSAPSWFFWRRTTRPSCAASARPDGLIR